MKKRWIFILLTIVFLWLIVSRFTELEQLQQTLTQGKWEWVFYAFILQVIYYIIFAASYQSAFKTVGIQSRIRELIPIMLGSIFVNVVVPAGGAGGAALFTEDLSKRGKSASKAAAGVLLQMIADFGAFTLVLIPGLIYLFIQHDLKFYEIVAAMILFIIVAGLSAILLVGIWNIDILKKFFFWVQKKASWLFGKLNRSLSLADDWAQKNIEDFYQASKAVTENKFDLLRTIFIAFTAHIVDIFSLYCLFTAFNQPIHISALIAGYAVGILFWIVSITPQGIGVVEGMMALAYTSLGIPGAIASTVALTFRGITFWLPTIAGYFAIQHTKTLPGTRHTLTEKWSVRIIAILIATMGLINVFSAVTPSLLDRVRILEQFSPLEIRHGGHLTSTIAGFALLVLAGHLARRKKVAWLLTIIVLVISIVSHLIKGLDYEEAGIALSLIILLWITKAHFHARSDRPSIKQGIQALMAAFLFTLFYGVSGLYLLDKHFSINFGFWAAFQQTIVMFTQFYDPGLNPITHFGKFFADSIYFVGIINFSYAGFMLLRPVFVRNLATHEEYTKAEGIINHYGHSSLARFLLFDDKRYFFSEGGSVIGYALENRTAVTLGDPIGPDQDLSASIHSFQNFCRQNDWHTVFYQTLPETLNTYQQAGFNNIGVGEEGIINLKTFSIEGKEGKTFRSAVKKIANAGYKFIIHEPPISTELLVELRNISNEWLTMMHGTKKRFSLGWFEDSYIGNSRIAAVYAPEGWIVAFANLIPEYQLNEITIDLMRRRKEIENGVMEFLFVSLFQWATSANYDTFNLGLSSLSGIGEKPDDPTVEKVVHWIYEHVNQFYNFKGLHSFKAKFHPAWSPRYLIYEGKTNMVNAWVAVMKANSGDGKLISNIK